MMRILRSILRVLLVAFFVFAGVNHFRNPAFYLRMMPPYLPWHPALNYISGFFEVLLGLMVLVPSWRKLAGWGLILLLIAIFPANLHVALNAELFPELPASAYYIRLPFQLLFIAWVYWTCLTRAALGNDRPR